MEIKHPKSIKWPLLALLFAFTLISRGDSTTLRFFSTNGSSELATSHVLSMAQDRSGYMWFATMQGLFRYDGYETRRYVPMGYQPRQYAGVSMVCLDGNGTLWGRLSVGSMCFYDSRHDCLSLSCDSLLKSQGINISNKSMFLDNSGDIWSQEKNLLKHYSFSQKRLFAIKGAHDIRNIVKGKDCHYALDGKGNIYKVSGEKMSLLARIEVKSNDEFVFYLDHSSTLWVTQKHVGSEVWQVSTKDGSTRQNEKVSSLIGNDFIRDITDDGRGNIWFGSNCMGIVLYNKATDAASLIQKSHQQLTLPSNHIEKLLVCGNVMWVGTGQRGPSVVSLEASPVMRTDVDEMERITSLLEDSEGNIWVGFDGSGVRRINKNGEQTFYSTSNSNLPSNTIIGMFQHEGKVWLYSYGGGIFYYDGSGFIKEPVVASHPELSLCQTCFFDSRGNLWESTFTHGVYCIKWQSVRKIKGIATNNITAMAYSAGDGRVYVGTDIGVYSIEPSGQVRQIIHGTRVSCLMADNASRLWMGTNVGLDCVDYQGNVIATLTHNNGLASDNILALALDRRKGVWVGCTDGISHISLGERGQIGSIHTFAHSDAQTRYNFYRNAVSGCANGDVIFAGDGELMRMDKQMVSGKRTRQRVFFTTLHIGDRVKSVDENKIRIKYDDRNFSVSVSSFNYNPNQSITYRYRLSKGDSWMVTDGNIISFNGLAYGDYNLEVQAKDITGEYGDSSVLHIQVLPPWYWSVWARLIYLLLFMGTILAYIIYTRRRYSRKMENQRVRLEKKGEQDVEDAKIKILTNVIDEELLQKVSNAVTKNISNANYSVMDLSRDLKMSHSGLYKKLMTITGKSPLEYMHLIRLKRGKEIIDGGETSISQVAYQVGLSPKQFSRYFKQVYGALPSEYLVQMKKQEE